MVFWKRKEKEQSVEQPVIDVSLEQVRQAIKQSASTLPLNISMRSLANDDLSIDFTLLKPILKGIPSKPYYMSKETLEVFEEREFAEAIDNVQRAIDQYKSETGKWPIVAGDSSNKISYFLIKDYLRNKPNIELYLHPKDHMVTHRRPNST